MSNLTTAILVVTCINIMLFLGQASVTALGGNQYFYDETTGTCMNSNPANSLPDSGQSVDPDTGLSYTDDYSTGKNFLTGDKGKCTTSIINAPANFMKYLGTPAVFNYAVEFLWYGLTVFLFVSWLLGRDA
jgi:hypothetical protein